MDEATPLDLTTDDPFGHEPPPDDSGHTDTRDGGVIDGGDPTDFS